MERWGTVSRTFPNPPGRIALRIENSFRICGRGRQADSALERGGISGLISHSKPDPPPPGKPNHERNKTADRQSGRNRHPHCPRGGGHGPADRRRVFRGRRARPASSLRRRNPRAAGSGAAAYLNAGSIIAAASATNCDAIHPGYGFLAERADFARQCADAGLTFVGPAVRHLELFGDKARARRERRQRPASVPVIHGIDRAVTLDEAHAFFASLGPGRARRSSKPSPVAGVAALAPCTRRKTSRQPFNAVNPKAAAAFGRGDVYVEEFLPRARHVEVQILGDHVGSA